MCSHNCILEKQLDNYPNAISPEEMDIIKEHMEKSVCKIICPKGGYGTGFFCKIPFPDELNLLRVLITNNHVLGENDIIQGYKITFSLKNDKYFYEILIDNERKIYTNKEYDITIIEIKEKDKLKSYYKLLEIDEDIFKEDLNNIYENKTIYLIQYPKGNKVKYSTGVIKNIKNNEIEHLCPSEAGSSGGPLIKLLNFKVIGLNKGGSLNDNFNLGVLAKEPLIKFKEKYINKKNSNKKNLLKHKNNTSNNLSQKSDNINIQNNDNLINPNNNIKQKNKSVNPNIFLNQNNDNDNTINNSINIKQNNSVNQNNNIFHNSKSFLCKNNKNSLNKSINNFLNGNNNEKYNNKKKNNYIIAEIEIKEEDININIRIIN